MGCGRSGRASCVSIRNPNSGCSIRKPSKRQARRVKSNQYVQKNRPTLAFPKNKSPPSTGTLCMSPRRHLYHRSRVVPKTPIRQSIQKQKKQAYIIHKRVLRTALPHRGVPLDDPGWSKAAGPGAAAAAAAAAYRSPSDVAIGCDGRIGVAP